VSRSAQQIQDWMTNRLCHLLGVTPQEIDPHEPIRRYGLDSVTLVAFIADLEEWLGYRFHSNPLTDDSTLETLAAFLAEQTAKDDRTSK
jgi:acyl carrier protein